MIFRSYLKESRTEQRALREIEWNLRLLANRLIQNRFTISQRLAGQLGHAESEWP